jgi:polysaccharide biosynthesis protein PslH
MMLRLLFITRTYPYPTQAGDLCYTAGLIESLAASPSIEITVFCGANRPAVTPHGRAIWVGPIKPPHLMTDISSLVSRSPRSALRAHSKSTNRDLRRLLLTQKFDFALINEAVCARSVAALAQSKTPTLYISHNVEADIRPKIAAEIKNPIRRWLQCFDAAKYRQMELGLLGHVAALTAITEQDLACYNQLAPDLPAMVLKPGYSSESKDLPPAIMTQTPKSILIGSFEWSAKQMNLEAILQAYRAFEGQTGLRFPLRIAGKMPSRFAEKLRCDYPDIEICRNFQRIAEVLQDATVALVLEDLGGGFKLKALDYIFHGLAIVGLAQTMNGSGLRAGVDYIEVSSLQSAMPAIAALLQDGNRSKGIAASARHRAEGQFDWSDRAARLIAFMESLQKSDPQSGLPIHPANACPKVDIDRV